VHKKKIFTHYYSTLLLNIITQMSTQANMIYVPELVVIYEIIPFIRLALENESIRVAVKDYLKGGYQKDSIINRYGKVENWDTSKVTDMNYMFISASTFNQDISGWDTSSVTTMSNMFHGCVSFDQPIGRWDTSSVTDMEGMFAGAENFDHDISGWDISKVTERDRMFHHATSFNLENSPWSWYSTWYHE